MATAMIDEKGKFFAAGILMVFDRSKKRSLTKTDPKGGP
jgi:hypothetical protein